MSMIQSGNQYKFPKNFFWGAATAAHQVEGGTHNQWTIWELENASIRAKLSSSNACNKKSWNKVSAQASDPNNYISGKTADHYYKYLDDFKILKRLNMNAYRFSIEWSRVEPEEGMWDEDAVNHYRKYIEDLRRRDIEPFVTLFHFTLPVWFSGMGGFEKRSNIKYFTRFAKRIINEIGLEVKYVITINEPEVYAVQGYFMKDWPPEERNLFKFWRVLNNLASAHRQVAKVIHELGQGHKVSISKNSSHFYAGDDSWLSRTSVYFFTYLQDYYFLNKVAKHCDFLGVNFYVSQRIYGYRIHNPQGDVGDLDWGMQLAPGNIQFVLERLYNKYKLPIIVTENGLADGQDISRKWWINETIVAMQKAIKSGVELKGYLHWSLIDNFEWSFGRWPRFGLVEVNYKTGERTIRPSAVWFGKVIGQIRGLRR